MPVLECFKDCGCLPQSICCVIFAQQKRAAKHDRIARKIARELGLSASDHWLNCLVARQPASCTKPFGTADVQKQLCSRNSIYFRSIGSGANPFLACSFKAAEVATPLQLRTTPNFTLLVTFRISGDKPHFLMSFARFDVRSFSRSKSRQLTFAFAL